MTEHDKKIGLAAPDRAPIACDGRSQHNYRPSSEDRQNTRTFTNERALQFGSEDYVDDLKPDGPFFRQVLQVEGAKAEIRAVNQYHHVDENSKASTEALSFAISNVPEILNKDFITDNSENVTSMNTASNAGLDASRYNIHMTRQVKVAQRDSNKKLPKVSAQIPDADAHQSGHLANARGLAQPGFLNDNRRGDSQNNTQMNFMTGMATTYGDRLRTSEPKHQGSYIDTRRGSFQNTDWAGTIASTGTTHSDRPKTSEPVHLGFSVDSHRGIGFQTPSQMAGNSIMSLSGHEHPHPDFVNRRGGGLQNTVQAPLMHGMAMPNIMHPSFFNSRGVSQNTVQAPPAYGMPITGQARPDLFDSPYGGLQNIAQAPPMYGMPITGQVYHDFFDSPDGDLQNTIPARPVYGMPIHSQAHPGLFNNHGGGFQNTAQVPPVHGNINRDFVNNYGGGLHNAAQAPVNNDMIMSDRIQPVIITNTHSSNLQDNNVQAQAINGIAAIHGDGYKTPERSDQDLVDIYNRAMAHAALESFLAKGRFKRTVNHEPDKFFVLSNSQVVWFSIAISPTLVGLVKNVLDSDEALPNQTQEPSMGALTAPRGGLSGVQRVQGFSDHRYGQENHVDDTNPTPREPDWLGWPDPPPGPSTFIHPPGTSQRVIDMCESGIYEVLLQDVLIIVTMPGETDWWGAAGPSLRFLRISENGGRSNHPLITDIAPFSGWEWGNAHNINERNRDKFKSMQKLIREHHWRDKSKRGLKLDQEAAVKADADERRERATNLLSTSRGGLLNDQNDSSRIDPSQSTSSQTNSSQSNPPLQLSPTHRRSGHGRWHTPYVGMEERVLARRGDEGSPPRRFTSWPPKFEGGKTFNEMIGIVDQRPGPPPREPFIPYIPIKLLENPNSQL